MDSEPAVPPAVPPAGGPWAPPASTVPPQAVPPPPVNPPPAPPDGRDAAAPPPETFRLHPLTPVALGGRILGVLAVLLTFSLAEPHPTGSGGPNWTLVAIYGGLAAFAVGRGAVNVAVTRYHLIGGELRIDKGLLNRQSSRVRLDRVQSVDVLEPLNARLFGLAELKVNTAGTERSAVRLRYLSERTAHALRADLLGRSVAGRAGAPEAPERPVLTVPARRIVQGSLLELLSWRLVLLLVGPILTVVGQRNGHRATSAVGAAVILWALLLIAHSLWRRISVLWGFTVTESPDGLRISHGLLSTLRHTVPPGRIQALQVDEPVLWRLFGWARVRMNVAGTAGKGSGGFTVLVPVIDRAHALSLAGWVLGGLDVSTVPLTRPPGRAALRCPVWWRGQLAGVDDRVFVVRHGLLGRRTDVVPHGRTQSVRLTAGPVQRALGLATVHLDSVRGPVRTRASNRPVAEARGLLDGEVARDRAVRAAAAAGRRGP